MENFIHFENLDWFAPFDGLKAKLVHSENQTCAFWVIDKDAVLPEHQHPHEQVSIVTKGKLQLTVGGQSQVVEPGMVVVIPSNTDHSAVALTDVEVTDVFYPVREDFPGGK